MANRCPTIRIYQGTKSQKILEMIAEKRREETKKKIPQLIKDKQLVEVKKSVVKKEKELSLLNKRLKKRLNELGIQEGYGKNHYMPLDFCDCDRLTYKRLQEAQDLWSLGRKNDAEMLWNSIMKKHNILI